MAAVVEHFSGGLMGRGFVEREEEHSSVCAEAFLFSRRMPARRESLRRENDSGAAGFDDGVAACLFERAHEGGDAGSAGSNARSGGNKGVPFRRTRLRRAVAFDRNENGEGEKVAVSVCEPFAAEKGDASNLAEEARVAAAEGGARRVFADIASEGGELAVAFDYPVVPFGLEDRRRRRRAAAQHPGFSDDAPTLRRRAGGDAQSFARCRVCGNNPPVVGSKCFHELADNYAKRHPVRSWLYLYHQVDVVGHDHKRRDFLDAPPFAVEAVYRILESDGNRIFLKLPAFADSGEIGEPGRRLSVTM